MAIDPRNQLVIDRARITLAAAERTTASISEFLSLGSRRVMWSQPYLQKHADEQMRISLNEARSSLPGLITQLERAEQSLAERLTAAIPYVCSPDLQQAISALTEFASLARPGNTARLITSLQTLPIPDGDIQRLHLILKTLESVERRGADRLAREHADRYTYRGSPQWHKHYISAIDKHRELWSSIGRYVNGVRQKHIAEEQARREQHVPRLLAAHPAPLVNEYVAVMESTDHLSVIEAAVSSYVITEQRNDVVRERLLHQVFASRESMQSIVYPEAVTLNEDDVRLASRWAGPHGNTPYWTSAMLSARRAERSVLRSYAALYGMATDLSIEQLGGVDARWRSADIEAGGLLIDVKNARKSFTSPRSYSEHCVPRFKNERGGGDVIISGVLSPYVISERAEPDGDGHLTWLGEVTQTDIARLSEEFQSEYLDTQLRTDQRGSFIPPWLFEYPQQAYADRRQALAELKAMNEVLPRREVPIAGGILLDIVPEAGSSAEVREARNLLARKRKIALTRPAMFLHIIDTFCRSLIERSSFPGDAMRAMLFPIGDEKAPLGMCDPLVTISSLLETLSKVEPALDDWRFVQFRLAAPGIFRGCTVEGRWQTIIAYCGGWKTLESGKQVRCGENPIALGEDRPCPNCGYLVCSACNFCKTGCPGPERLRC